MLLEGGLVGGLLGTFRSHLPPCYAGPGGVDRSVRRSCSPAGWMGVELVTLNPEACDEVSRVERGGPHQTPRLEERTTWTGQEGLDEAG